MDLSQHQRTHYLKGGKRRQRNMKPTQIHFIIRSLKCWLSPIGLHCELYLMLEVAASLHLNVKSAVTADCCNLMIGLMHNDFITVSLRAALDAAASQVSRFPRIDRLHFDVVWSLWQCWLLWLNHWSRRLNFPPRVIREPYILVRFWTLSLWSRVIRGSGCMRVYTVINRPPIGKRGRGVRICNPFCKIPYRFSAKWKTTAKKIRFSWLINCAAIA